MKSPPDDPTENRACDLLACTEVRQPTVPPGALTLYSND